MSKSAKVIKMNPKSKGHMSETLKQMEIIVDNKLANQKVFTPILLTVVTSIIAFLFVHNLGDSIQAVQMYMLAFCYALLCFVILIIMLYGKSDYEAVEKKTTEVFRPHKLGSYCHVSDAEFLRKLSQYAGRKLTLNEVLKANCLKQKINEYAFKAKKLHKALSIILAGALILGLICAAGVFLVPQMPQFSGGTT